ncbi:filamentous hemagglutinin N-terminal domain-containing protein, partial [Escherichia coli]
MHQPPVRFTYRLLSYLISTIIAGQPLLPAVGAVITPQNGAGMDKAANGVPVVNIATPNGAGISHNRFTDYNVGKEGLILNNATGKLNPTQLGGLIQNNPNLKAGGEAKGIINEVTGGNRSLLQGYTEVAGKAANVMVANPYGITCDGCGFINTPHATLTTGRPVMNADGSLQALEVTEGSITINGAGLDGTRSDAVSIIARATEVNAALHAKDLTVTAGANRITADGRVSALKGEGDVPKVAVDTGALGGMYARRIHLTSTESGVGVNLGNLYARDGDITLDASGRLTVNNSLATGAVTAKGQGVTLTGDHKAGGNLSVSSRSDIVLSNGTLNSDKDLSLTAGGRITQQNEKLTAGRDVTLAAKNITQDTASQINAARDIVTVASDTLTTQGQITAGQNLTASATTLTQDGILLAKGHAGLDAGTLNNSGAVQGASLTLGSTTLSNSGSLLSGGPLTVNTRDFTQSGRTGAKGKVDITASGKLTSTGSLVSDDVLVLKAQDVTQNGVLSGGKGLTVSAQALSSGKKSVTHSDAAMTLNVTTVALDGENSAGDTLRVQADKLSTAAGAQLQSGKNLSINARDARLAGTQAAQQTMVVNASEKLTHSGKSSAPSLSLSAPELTSSGVLVGSALNTQSQTLTNSGTLTGIAALTLAARMASPQPALMNNGGSLLTSGDLTITAGSITSSGHWQGKRVLITADSLANSGAIQAADSLTARLTGELVSTAGSKVTSNGEMALSALNLSNSGQWIAKNLTLKANSLTSAGDITGVDALTLTVNQTLHNHASGKLLSAGVLTLKADSVTNDGQLQGNATTITAGQLTNGGHLQGETLTLAASGGVNNRSGGVLMSRNALNVSTATLSNQGTIQGGGGVSLNATDRLQNDGKILSGSNLTLTAQVLANTGSGLVQAATLLLDVVNTVNGGRVLATGSADVKGTTLNNTGTLQGADLLVNYHTFSNSGTLLGTSGLGVKGSSLLQNGTGRLYSAGNLLLDAQDFSGQGQVVATGDVTLKLIAALTNYGTLAAGKTLSVTSQNAITNGGVMQGDAMVLGAGEAFTNNGTLTAGKGNSVFSAQRLFLNAPGSLQGGGDVSLNSRSDITISGFTGTAGSLTMNVAGTLLNSAL